MPLLVSDLLRGMEQVHHSSEVVTADPTPRRFAFADIADRSRRLAAGLRGLGIRPGGVVATLAWNTHEHLETLLATTLLGATVNAVNVRMSADILAGALRDPAADVLVVDASLLDPADRVGVETAPVVREFAAAGRPVVIVGGTGCPFPGAYDYQSLLVGEAVREALVADEDAVAFIFHSGGTTGPPKSYPVSQRAVMLHALAQRDPLRRPGPAAASDLPRQRLGAAAGVAADRRLARPPRP